MSEDLYVLLGVSREASNDDIKKAYKKLAMTHHPDRGGNEEYFKKINEAYAVLTDPEKRNMYDRFGSVDMTNVQMPDMSDIMENLFGFSFAGGSQSRQQKAADRIETIELSLNDIYTGTTIPFTLKRRVLKKAISDMTKCSECNGKGMKMRIHTFGFMQQQSITPCNICKQSGYVTSSADFTVKQDRLQITIPKGIPDGHNIVLKEKTDEHPGMKTGDVILVIRYKKHSLYKTVPENNDLLITIDITLEEALCGFTRDLPFLDGSTLRIRLPRGHIICRRIGSGNPIRKIIYGYGLSTQNRKKDLIIDFQIHFPVMLSESAICDIENSLMMKSLETTLPSASKDNVHEIVIS